MRRAIVTSMDDVSGLSPGPPRMALEEGSLSKYLRLTLPSELPENSHISIRQFKGGTSNPTYLLQVEGADKCVLGRYVLRKQPPGKLIPGAHQLQRDYKVMHALRLLPRMICLCEERTVQSTCLSCGVEGWWMG